MTWQESQENNHDVINLARQLLRLQKAMQICINISIPNLFCEKKKNSFIKL